MKKEEPKIYTQDDYFNDEFPKEKPKQETLEEAAYRLSSEKFEPKHIGFMIGVIAGAKWQQEKIYNEIKELYDNENITGFSKLAYAKCLDIIKKK